MENWKLSYCLSDYFFLRSQLSCFLKHRLAYDTFEVHTTTKVMTQVSSEANYETESEAIFQNVFASTHTSCFTYASLTS